MKTVIDENGNVYLWEKGDLHISKGLVKENEIKNGVIKTNKNKKLLVFDAGFIDKLNKIKRGPAILTKKDIGIIISNTGVNEKSKVVDAGTGSGVLASFLGRISKHVVSYEKNEDFYNICKKNVEFLDSKVKLKNQDIYDGIDEKDLDIITLDLLEPWKVMEHAFQSLKSGGFLVCYVTNVNQLMEVVNNLRGFYVEKICENIEREWEVDGLKVRPKNKGIMHTGFLVFLRRI